MDDCPSLVCRTPGGAGGGEGGGSMKEREMDDGCCAELACCLAEQQRRTSKRPSSVQDVFSNDLDGSNMRVCLWEGEVFFAKHGT